MRTRIQLNWWLCFSDARPGVSHNALYSMDDLDLPTQEQQMEEEIMEDDNTSMDFVWLYFLRGIHYLLVNKQRAALIILIGVV